MSWLQDARAVWRTLVILITPLVLLPLAWPGTAMESKCSFVLALMAVYWITECLPLPVTALLPLVLLPLLNIMASKEVCVLYFKDVVVLLIGSLMVALAIEESSLHKRFALRLLLTLGVQPRKLLLGFMLATGLLSMWITNTATTAMMTPIARALLARLFKAQRQHRNEARRLQELEETVFTWPVGREDHEGDVATLEKELDLENKREVLVISNEVNGPHPTKDDHDHDKKDSDTPQTPDPNSTLPQKDNTNVDDEDDDDEDDGEITIDIANLDKRSADLVKALCLCVCYSANIGGVGTLTGTGPNIVFKNYVESLSKGEGHVSYVSWMAFGAPVAAVNLVVAWLWLQLFFFGVKNTLLCRRQTRPEEDAALTRFLRKEHRKLGPMSFAEKVVLGHFMLMVGLWLTRAPGVFPGWSIIFPNKKYVSDAVPAVLVSLSLFVFPKARPAIFCSRRKGNNERYVSSPSILQWSTLSRKFPWGVLLLLGGGFALAEATQVSGLSTAIADQLMVIGSFPPWAACIIVVLVTSVTTEITSNTVIATLLLPILAQVAVSMNIHPIYFMLPSSVAASFAFMLPVATPPNAIVFAHGDVKVVDMIKTGVALNVICIAILTLAINTFGTAYFHLDHFPDWAAQLAPATPTTLQNVTSALLNGSTPLMNMHESSATRAWKRISPFYTEGQACLEDSCCKCVVK